MKFTAQLDGIVNQQSIKLNGKGTLCELTGKTHGEYDLLNIPKGFDSMLLSAVLITGYPNASHSHENVKNVFKGKSYSYEREINFRDGGKLNLKVNCKHENDLFKSDFVLTGNVEFYGLTSVEPLVESWQPIGSGNIKGHFMAAWQSKRGLIAADAFTDYKIENSETQPNVLHRYISIDSFFENNRLIKDQQVSLFHKAKFISDE